MQSFLRQISLSFIFASFALNAADRDVSETTFPMLDSILHTTLKNLSKDWEIPGCAIAIIQDQKIIFQQAYGIKQLGSLAPVNDSTLFLLGPCSKTFTSAALLLLADRGLIQLDDRVQQYMPDFVLYDPWVSKELTIRDTLLQRIGFESNQGKLLWKWGYDKHDLLFRLRYLEPKHAFRTHFSDCSLNYMLQSHLLTRITNYSWENFIERYILSPLNLRQTHVGLGAFSRTDNIAIPHLWLNQKLQPQTLPEVDTVAPAGLISTSIVDFAQWARCWLHEGSLGKVHLLSPRIAQEVFLPQMPVLPSNPVWHRLFPELGHNDFVSYSMGWFIHTYQGQKVVEQIGTFPGMSAMIALIPEKKIGIVALVNRDVTSFLSVIKLTIFDQLLEVTSPPDWNKLLLKMQRKQEQAENKQKQEMISARQKNTSPTLDLSSYTGTYFNPLYGELKVLKKNDALILQAGVSAVLGEMTHWQYDLFRIKWKSLLLRKTDFASFTIDANGDITTLHINSAGTFKRQTAGDT